MCIWVLLEQSQQITICSSSPPAKQFSFLPLILLLIIHQFPVTPIYSPEIASCCILNWIFKLGFSSGLGAPDCRFTIPFRFGSFWGVILPTSHVNTCQVRENSSNRLCGYHLWSQGEASSSQAGYWSSLVELPQQLGAGILLVLF